MPSPPKSQPLDPGAPFTVDSVPTGLTVGHFWQWAHSNLLLNTLRGKLAEFIVSRALGINEPTDDAWGHADLMLPSGVTIEVKSSAFLQSWEQSQLTPPAWKGLRSRRTAQDDGAKWRTDDAATAKGDMLVLALFTAKDYSSANPRELAQWAFWPLLSADILNASISLGEVERRFRRCSYESLAAACLELEAAVLAQRLSAGAGTNAR